MSETHRYTPDNIERMSPDELQAVREDLWARGREMILAADCLYIDSDVEANGIAGYGSLHALASESPTGEWFHREIKPYSELSIPSNQAFCDAHGYTRERLMDEGEDLAVVMHDYNDWVLGLAKKYGKPPMYTGVNVAFDWAHIDLAFMQSGIQNPFGVEPFDTQSIMLPFAGSWNWSNTSVANLPTVIVPQVEFTHNPLDDSRYQQKLFFGMVALLGTTHPTEAGGQASPR